MQYILIASFLHLPAFIIFLHFLEDIKSLHLSNGPSSSQISICGIQGSGFPLLQRYTYRVLQTIHMKVILLCVWTERAVLGSAKTALKFKYEI